jgi:tetratricopeptide (TPR) repeat protein
MEAAAAIDEDLDADTEEKTGADKPQASPQERGTERAVKEKVAGVAQPSKVKEPSSSSARPKPAKEGRLAKKKAKPQELDSKPLPTGKSFDSLMRLARKTAKSNKSRGLMLYKQALGMKPMNPGALVNVGKLQMKLGQASAAITTLEKCRKVMPRYTPCMYWLGRTHERAGRKSAAKKVYESYLDVNPDGSQASDVRARLGL